MGVPRRLESTLTVDALTKVYRENAKVVGVQDLPPSLWSIVKLQVPVREIEWAGKEPLTINNKTHPLAVLVYICDVEVLSPCEQCCRATSPVFKQCVIWPIYDGRSIHHAACASCLWHGRGASCSIRKKGAAKCWDDILDNDVLARGGILHAKGYPTGVEEPEDAGEDGDDEDSASFRLCIGARVLKGFLPAQLLHQNTE